MAPHMPPVSDPIPPARPTQPAPAGSPVPASSPAAPAREEPIQANPKEQVQIQTLTGQSTAPVVPLVGDTPDLKAHGETLFKSKLGVKDKTYLKPDDTRLLGQLKEYHQMIEGNRDMKLAIGRNPRGLDFMHSLEKAARGEALSRDNIQSIQLFLVKDTRFGGALAYEGEPSGMDRKCGPRTLGTLDHFMRNFQKSDLVDDPYYQRLDRDGVKYARLQE